MAYEAVIGLEVHCQLLTKTKIFCSCSTEFGKTPNSQTCPVCQGMPGVLPVVNRKVIELAMRTALATNCTIRNSNQFARKNYFYPDLPKGYQISQFELPIAEGGFLEIEPEGQSRKRIGITRIHMEEDAGKLMHELDGVASDSSFVDFNRTGVPLIEIVSEPDMRSPEEAKEYLRSLRSIVQYLDVCDGNMEQGSFRCDANVSLRPEGSDRLGTKVELKNMNSFRHVERALAYEIERQEYMLDDEDTIVQETRLWNESSGETFSMRGKEEAHDYRYFPDPDLVPIMIDDAWIEQVRRTFPELPRDKIARFVEQYGLPEYDAKVLCASRQVADYFEQCVTLGAGPKPASNWIMSDIMRHLEDTRAVASFPVTPRHLADMLSLIDNGTISGKIAKSVFEEMLTTGALPDAVVKEKGLVQLSDRGEIGRIVESVLKDNPRMVEEYRGGKEKLLGFFVGRVMKATGGKANPTTVNELLREKLHG